MRVIFRSFVGAVLAGSLMAVASGANWAVFRGTDGSGVSAEKDIPQTWSLTENLVWKTSLPGAGGSCPIVWGDKVFVTCYSGYGLDQNDPGDIQKLARHLVCVDAAGGKILWQKREPALQPEQAYTGFITMHGYASNTPVTDGEKVYVFYGRSGVYAYDMSGHEAWHAEVGRRTNGWGSGTSPLLAGKLLIVNASIESGSVVALDKQTGREVWRTGDIARSWSTPVLATSKSGRQDLVISIQGKVLGLDPATGKVLWTCTGIADYMCPAIVAHDDVVYVFGGRKPMTLAVRVGGQRRRERHACAVADQKISTRSPRRCMTMACCAGSTRKGWPSAWNAETGALVYKERLAIPGGGDKVYASLVLADGRLYCVTRQGGTIVLAAGEEFKELARNSFSDNSVANATPAVVAGGLILRTIQPCSAWATSSSFLRSSGLKGFLPMPLFEIETEAHIIITWADDERRSRGCRPRELSLRDGHPRDASPARLLGDFQSGLGHSRQERSLLHRPGLPLPRRRRQVARHSLVHAAHRHRPGAGSQSHRVQHGHGLVRRENGGFGISRGCRSARLSLRRGFPTPPHVDRRPPRGRGDLRYSRDQFVTEGTEGPARPVAATKTDSVHHGGTEDTEKEVIKTHPFLRVLRACVVIDD